MEIDYSTLVGNISKYKFDPVYFLQGDEPFFIDDILRRLDERVLEEGQKSFNQYVLYGKDTSMEQVISTARKFPMMGERQLILVKEAQEMKGWQKELDQSLLLQYLEAPTPSTILAFGYKYKSLDKRTKLAKAISKGATVMPAKKLYDDKIPGWIQSYSRAQEMDITPQAVQLLATNIGNNLQRLSNEFEKLKLNIAEDGSITEELVHKYVGISKEYNSFELQKAIAKRDLPKALRIIRFFAQNPSNNPLILILFGLFSYFSRLVLVHEAGTRDKQQLAGVIGVNPFFVPEYVEAANNYPKHIVLRNLQHIYQADLQSKGINSINKKEYDVLTELIYKLMN